MKKQLTVFRGQVAYACGSAIMPLGQSKDCLKHTEVYSPFDTRYILFSEREQYGKSNHSASCQLDLLFGRQTLIGLDYDTHK